MTHLGKIYSKIASLLILTALIISQLASCVETPETPPPKPPVDEFTLPEYTGKAWVAINGDIPFFTTDDMTTESFERYSKLDALGRCQTAFACVGLDIMPTEERDDDLSSVTPTGWEYNGQSNNNSYSVVPGGYVYNRCHLLGFQLTGEGANELNLITGTRYLNIQGMLPFENLVADYVKESGNHVLLRVTPIFEGNDYVARGVVMEGYSVEDGGEAICFCIYAFNVQPEIYIDYYTGRNRLSSASDENEDEVDQTVTYVLNTHSKKYHLPTCYHAESIDPINRLEYKDAITDFLTKYPGYEPCGTCHPELTE